MWKIINKYSNFKYQLEIFKFERKLYELFLSIEGGLTILEKQQGIHLYINIKNLDKLVMDDAKDGKLNHVIHQMNTLFTSIEKFVNDNYKQEVIIEKVTGSRLHLIINDEKQTAIMIVICKFAYMLSKEFTTFTKYSNLELLSLQFGADVGFYSEAEIKLSDDTEYTSIGYPANYAAKLQSISYTGSLYVSEKLYDLLDYSEKKNFEKIREAPKGRKGVNFFARKVFSCMYLSL